jgi:hypothetical protein
LDACSFVVAISDDCNKRKQHKVGDPAGLRNTAQRKRFRSTNTVDNRIPLPYQTLLRMKMKFRSRRTKIGAKANTNMRVKMGILNMTRMVLSFTNLTNLQITNIITMEAIRDMVTHNDEGFCCFYSIVYKFIYLNIFLNI